VTDLAADYRDSGFGGRLGVGRQAAVLAATLTATGVDTLFVCGLTTSGCVRASATDALQHGFRPLVVADACGDRDDRIQAANLLDLEAKYADVLSLDTTLALIGGLGRPD
jgi:maleamate amidohydrolase